MHGLKTIQLPTIDSLKSHCVLRTTVSAKEELIGHKVGGVDAGCILVYEKTLRVPFCYFSYIYL